MYTFVLTLHNLLRWAIIILALWALYSAFTGIAQKRGWTENDRKSGSYFTIVLTIQLLIGLLLYFVVSPVTRAAFADMSAAMSNGALRFIVVEHFILMFIAVALAHIGTAVIKRRPTDRAKFMNAAIWYTLTLLVVLAGIPWDRPLFRLFS